MTTVVLTPRLFDSPRNGGEMCTERLLRELETAGHRLLVIGRGDAPRASAGRRYISVGPGVPAFDSLGCAERVGLVLQALLSRQASTVQRLSNHGAAQRAGAALGDQARQGIECLIVDHLQVLGWLDRAGHSLPAPLLVMHNLESEVQLGQARADTGSGLAVARRGFRMRESRLLRELEAVALSRAGAVACLSDSDAQVLRSLAREAGTAPHIGVLPGYPLLEQPGLGHDVGHRTSSHEPRRIGMIGTWTWAPNRLALQWMIERVLPQLPASCTLVLAGSGLELLQLPPRVRSLGRVDHPHRLYEAVDLVAVPSVTGSGVQEKAIEAVASGRPVVATRHALRGLMHMLPAHVHVTDDAEAFASRCAGASLGLPADAATAVRAWAAASRHQYVHALSTCLAAAQTRPRRDG